jgi:translocation and assembly module TamB
VPDLTFTIRCPGNLWLRGQGLDVELSGDLALHLRDGKPAIEGELEAKQGTMKQLGRVFNLRRGRIVFYADEEELNPELDLALGVRVGSYDITIALTGTAAEPKLEFSSSPDLGDGDIISVLLFGKTSDELDEGQSGLMAERAAQMALAYGSVQLQERLARELGVDVLSIAPRADDSSKSSLTVGKYLNPKVMVRYEQILSEESAFFVHLDYSLVESQEWKLHSQVSQGEASGVEIKWEKDW